LNYEPKGINKATDENIAIQAPKRIINKPRGVNKAINENRIRPTPSAWGCGRPVK